MEIGPNFGIWGGLWENPSQSSYPSASFEQYERAVPSREQLVNEIIELDSDEDADSAYMECNRLQNAYLDDGMMRQQLSVNYCHRIASLIKQQLADSTDGNKRDDVRPEVQGFSVDMESSIENEKSGLAESTMVCNFKNPETHGDCPEVMDNKPSDKQSSVEQSVTAARRHPSMVKGKFINGRRRGRKRTSSMEYVACHVCSRIFLGTRARNIHINKAHAIVVSDLKVPGRKAHITSRSGINTIGHLTSTPGTTPGERVTDKHTVLSLSEQCDNDSRSTASATAITITQKSTQSATSRQHTSAVGALSNESYQLGDGHGEYLRDVEPQKSTPAYAVSSTSVESDSNENCLKLRIVSVESVKNNQRSPSGSSCSSTYRSPTSSFSSPCPSTLERSNELGYRPSLLGQRMDENISRKSIPGSQDVIQDYGAIQRMPYPRGEPTNKDVVFNISEHASLSANKPGEENETERSSASAPSRRFRQQKYKVSSSTAMDTTLRTADGAYQCRICKNLYPSRFSLTGHYKSHYDTILKPYPCDECGQRYTSRSNLKYHLLRNCSVTKAKALDHMLTPIQCQPQKVHLMLAKTRRAVGRKTKTFLTNKHLMANKERRIPCVETSRVEGISPTDTVGQNSLQVLHNFRPKEAAETQQIVVTMLDNTSQSALDVHLGTRVESPNDTDRPRVVLHADQRLHTGTEIDSSFPQHYSQQIHPHNCAPNTALAATEPLLPRVKQLIDQAYGSEEIRNKIVSLTSAAILSAISQRNPYNYQCTNDLQSHLGNTTPNSATASPSVSTNHVLKVLADAITKNRSSTNSHEYDFSITTGGLRQIAGNDADKGISNFNGNSTGVSAHHGSQPFTSNTSNVYCQGDMVHFRQSPQSVNTAVVKQSQQYHFPSLDYTLPTTSSAVRPLSLPASVFQGHAFRPVTSQGEASRKHPMGPEISSNKQPTTCKECGREFVGLAACRSHFTKMHIFPKFSRLANKRS